MSTLAASANRPTCPIWGRDARELSAACADLACLPAPRPGLLVAARRLAVGIAGEHLDCGPTAMEVMR